MIPLLLMILAAGLIAAIAGRIAARRARRKGETLPPPRAARPDGCCGQHEVCEKESLLAAVSKGIEYYDDEELDAYIGTAPERYTPEEEEQFRDILYTMRDEEVAGWVRSLQLRGIALPNALKDEVYLIIGERRSGASERHLFLTRA